MRKSKNRVDLAATMIVSAVAVVFVALTGSDHVMKEVGIGALSV